ncbi:hypothetical protein B0O99DRAFT_521531 [Bisporella sp. PMI_857]|nr:hypothetical protein B0O99DRAFT_521531 [Bisporella sp. PMI_857]
MSQPGSSEPLPSSSTTDNPIVAVGRRVKSALRSHQRPSIRIRRKSPSSANLQSISASQSTAEKYQPHLPPHGQSRGPNIHAEVVPASNQYTFASHFRSLFGHGEGATNDESHKYEYDSDIVDILDVVGMYS